MGAPWRDLLPTVNSTYETTDTPLTRLALNADRPTEPVIRPL